MRLLANEKLRGPIDLKEEVELHAANYTNGRLALFLQTLDGELYDRLSVNMPDEPCPANEVWLYGYSGRSWVPRWCIDNKIVEPEPVDEAPTGFVKVQRFRLTDRILQEISLIKEL